MLPAPSPGFVDRFFRHCKLSTDSYRHQLARGYFQYHPSGDFVGDWGTHDTQPEKFLGFGKSS